MLLRHAPVGASLLVALLSTAKLAIAAGPSAKECINANESGQDSRAAGKLRDARAKFVSCVAPSCPEAIRDDCAQRLAEVDGAMPTVVFIAKDAAGNDLSAVRVTMDGEFFAEKLDERPIALDSGEHRFVFKAEDGSTFEKTLTVREGERNRREQVVLGFAPVPVVTATRNETRVIEASFSPFARIPTLAYVAAGVGVVGLTVGISAGIGAGDKHAALKGECSPYPLCQTSQAQSDLNDFHTQRDWSTAGYVMGALGLVGAAVLWITAPNKPEVATARVRLSLSSVALVGTF